LGWKVIGVDNNLRKTFFGRDGDTSWNLKRLRHQTKHFSHNAIDIRHRAKILYLIKNEKPQLIIHCAAQPSHDLAARIPFIDFEVNAIGTLNLLEAARQFCAESPFIYLSTNKVYGDAPNEYRLKELKTRWDYANPEDYNGINESCRVDASLHSLFGASKLSADILVQEYGRYFSIPTVCFRCGCLTGPNHSGAELHGFLSYLVKANLEERTYKIFGYKGKQVRDNIHSFDVCTAFEEFYKNPKIAAIYNLGGGRSNSISILEAIHFLENETGKKMKTNYIEKNRIGDHICYISDLSKFKRDFPNWIIQKSLQMTIKEIIKGATKK
jgi:CDP-paratose 2-epimerase